MKQIINHPTFPSWYWENQQSAQKVAGVDEVGYGPWAGPVIAAAVIFKPEHLRESLLEGIRDSKQLSQQRREKIFEQLMAYQGVGVIMGVGEASVVEIDSLTIGKATDLAMQRAISALPEPPHVALVDGRRRPMLGCPLVSIIKGDQQSFSIAAASIIAKVTRDNLMKKLAQHYPDYGWDSNAGYGTKAHQQALIQFGLTPFHRRSYAPIARLLQGEGIKAE